MCEYIFCLFVCPLTLLEHSRTDGSVSGENERVGGTGQGNSHAGGNFSRLDFVSFHEDDLTR